MDCACSENAMIATLPDKKGAKKEGGAMSDTQNYPKSIDGLQLKAIELLAEGEKTLEEIATALGIERKTLYNWRQDDKFRQAIVQESRRDLEQAYPKFKKALLKRVDEGDVGAMRLYAQMMGEFDGKKFIAALKGFDFSVANF